MKILTWTPVTTIRLPAQDVLTTWLMAMEEVAGTVTHLRLKANGRWTPLAGLSVCGPDGLTGQTFPDDRLIVGDCPVGALIGRIGGSSATLKAGSAVADDG